MRIRFELKILIGFAIALLLIVGLGIYNFQNKQKQLESSRWVNHTNEVLYHSELLLSTVIDLETGQRGYALSGKEEFLQPYSIAEDSLAKRLQFLLLLTKDNTRQYQRILTLEKLIQKKVALSRQAIEARKKSLEHVINLISKEEGRKNMDSIRKTIEDFQTEEKQLMHARVLDNEYQIAKFNATFFFTLSLTAAVLTALMYMIYVNLKARQKAENSLNLAYAEIKDLYDNAPCGYHSLDSEGNFIGINNTLLTWLGYTREEIIGKKKVFELISPETLPNVQKSFPVFKEKGYVHNLEFDFVRKDGSSFPALLSSSAIFNDQGQYISSRSTTFDNTEQKEANEKIRALNHELEAFTYSVSHDLRSPLRSISGYTQILQEEYQERFDEEGKRVLSVVIKNANRMGHLIDDLLNFSRIGRKEFSHGYINMQKLVENTLQELNSSLPPEKLQIRVLPLLEAHGDINMIRQVWINLISNALKYAQKKECIDIQIGSYQDHKETTYYIKDNGAGFDMKYIDKLFGVFQRLHKINEFEGTGVGLALVKRIINRHEGRVWAEGKIDEGATFYFTLPR